MIMYPSNISNITLLDNASIFFVISISFGIYVITSKNPIVSVLFLIGLFLSIALYLMQGGITFIGLSYILVYVGAVSILFLFILMLINVRVSELVTDNNNGIPLSLMAISIFYFIFSSYALIGEKHHGLTAFKYIIGEDKEVNYNKLYFVSTSIWESILFKSSHISSIGNVIYTIYPTLLLITSLILLLSMIGSIIITLRQ